MNIHKGFGANGRPVALHLLKSAIESTGAEIVFLQEVIGRQDRTRDQLEFLADSVWTYAAYGKNAVYPSGHHGNAILSKFPIQSWENVDISNSRYELRGLQCAILGITPARSLPVFCIHLDLFSHGRRRQYQRVVDIIRSSTPDAVPLIVAGDFNDWSCETRRRFEPALILKRHS